MNKVDRATPQHLGRWREGRRGIHILLLGWRGPRHQAVVMVQQLTQGLLCAPSDCFLRIHTQAIPAPWVPFSKMPQRQAGCQGDLAKACPDSLGSSVPQRAHPTSIPGQDFCLLASQGLGSNSALPPGGQAVPQNCPDEDTYTSDQLTRTLRL